MSNESITAEQSVLGAIMLDNDAIDRITDLKTSHFYNHEHRAIFTEMRKQIGQGQRVDVISLYEPLRERVQECLQYLNQLAQNTPSAANITRYADIVIDRSIKRELSVLGREIQETENSREPADLLADRYAAKLAEIAERKAKQEPEKFSEMLGNYVETIQNRMEGKIKPIATGYRDLDSRLDGGLERGTLTVIAGRPGMGKTAFALGLSRNVSDDCSVLFLSMEMARDQVNDRNIAAIGKIPLSWLKNPCERNAEYWDNMTAAFARAQNMNLWIDDQTALNMLDIRAKARAIKRKHGLDMLVIDQLSFITGSDHDEQWKAVGEYTRALLAIAKELDIAVVLLCQLNRKCEDRQNKRPMLSDLAMSGSIEQDAANIIFLYRDEIYNPDTQDRGVCEVITAKQRQGETGICALAYFGHETRFEDMATQWQQRQAESRPPSRGFK